MSSSRVLPLLLAVLVLCVSLPVWVAATPGDPTVACYPTTYNATGFPESDAGFYHLYAFESYYSTGYQVMCAFRGWYANATGGLTMTPGPWHGQNKDYSDCDQGSNYNAFNVAGDWAYPGSGSVGMRINSLNNMRMVTSWKIGGVCSSNYICAGICPGTAAYELLKMDPTYEEVPFTAPTMAEAPRTMHGLLAKLRGEPLATNWQVASTLNTTESTSTVIHSPVNPSIYPDKVVPTITQIVPCYGYQQLTCAAPETD